jgi:uncharacterized protein YegP (UPF0339 family)
MQFHIVRGADGGFFWRIVDGSGFMVTFSSAQYRTLNECRDAVEDIRRSASGAAVVDLTGEAGSDATRIGEAS